MKPEKISKKIASLLLYQGVFANECGQAFINLLAVLEEAKYKQHEPKATLACLEAYGYWFQKLAATNKSWQDYLVENILLDDNPFSQQAQRQNLQNLPTSLLTATAHDLEILQIIYQCPPRNISKWAKATVAWESNIITKNFFHKYESWALALKELATYYRQNGTGIFAQYRAFTWQDQQLQGIAYPDSIKVSSIVGYESQKQALVKNTEFLLAGYPALHILLYGSRGSGKSSLVKSLLQEYSSRGLRLIEVAKSQLQYLPKIVDLLRPYPQKFIIFVDDLSFEEDDETFKSLKVVLEGSLTAKANNVVVYATSNRRHLIREYFGDRPRPSEGDEIHTWDTLQEKLSFSDRFGLTLTFEPANQDTYLEIVHHLALEAGITLEREDIEFRAKQWATQHNGRSGRSARQFVDFVLSDLSLNQSS